MNYLKFRKTPIIRRYFHNKLLSNVLPISGIKYNDDEIIQTFSDKFHINPGVRLSVYNGNDLEYITAPAEYTSNDDQIDTITQYSVQNNFANLYVRIGYDFTEKLSLSFDIDVVGVSFGGESDYKSFGPGKALQYKGPVPANQSVVSSPTALNVLLVGDNDLGSLNSTLSLTYNPTKKIGIDLGAGLVFTEYTTKLGRGVY